MKKNTDDVQTQINKMVIWDYILWFLSIFTGIMTLICYLQVYFSQLEIRFFSDLLLFLLSVPDFICH